MPTSVWFVLLAAACTALVPRFLSLDDRAAHNPTPALREAYDFHWNRPYAEVVSALVFIATSSDVAAITWLPFHDSTALDSITPFIAIVIAATCIAGHSLFVRRREIRTQT